MGHVPLITRADVSPNLFIALLPAIIVALVVLAIVGVLLYLRYKKVKPGTAERAYFKKNGTMDGYAPDPLLLGGYVSTQDQLGVYPGTFGGLGGGDVGSGGSSN